MSQIAPPEFVALLPVKPPAHGKSRLAGLGDDQRSALAAAFALDTAAACLASARIGEVLVVTDDVGFSSVLAGLGARPIPDGVTGDLNGTLEQAAAEAHRRWPALVPVALCADLPALLAADLDAALGSIEPGEAAFVGDAAGTGTTMYTAAYAGFGPRFGIGSAFAHEGSGARPIPGSLRTLRQDVDDLEDLHAAVHLGLGAHTAGVVTALGLDA